MKRLLKLLAVLFVGFLLSSCAKSGNERSYDILIQEEGTGAMTLTIYFGVDVESTAKSGDATTSTAPKTNLGLNGSTPTMGGAVEDVISSFIPDNSHVDDHTKVTNPAQGVPVPTIKPTDKKVSVGGLTSTENVMPKWSEDRGRMYQHLKLPALDYGLPVQFILTGIDCNETYTMTKYDSKARGSTSFTLMSKNGHPDDGLFFSDQRLDKRAEVLLPRSCGSDAKLLIRYFAE